MNKKKILNYIIIFLLIYITMGLFFKPGDDAATTSGQDFDVLTSKKEYGLNEIVNIKIKNNTNLEAIIKNECPNEPLSILKKTQGKWETITKNAEITCEDTSNTTINPDQEITIKYDTWNHMLFGELGTYKIAASIEVPDDPSKSITLETNEFEVVPQSWIGWIWTAGFYQPIYNALIFITSIIPGHDLGLAIILLTLIIRTILMIPSHKAMKSQRKMQDLQPKLNRIKEKYKDNQEMIAKETMALWKDNKVNPMGSCLPMLIQFPFLIAIFYVIQTGLSPNNVYLLYGPLKDFSLLSINVNFLGILDLTKINAFILPIIVGGLQFFQMKLAMLRNKKKKVDSTENKKDKKKDKGAEMEMATQMMVYVMPIMIALFTASLPAGVGIYWCSSTLFGIFQQYIVNRQVATENVKVRVVKK